MDDWCSTSGRDARKIELYFGVDMTVSSLELLVPPGNLHNIGGALPVSI